MTAKVQSISRIIPEKDYIPTLKRLKKLAKKQKLKNWSIEATPLRILDIHSTDAQHWAGTGITPKLQIDTHQKIVFSWEV